MVGFRDVDVGLVELRHIVSGSGMVEPNAAEVKYPVMTRPPLDPPGNMDTSFVSGSDF